MSSRLGLHHITGALIAFLGNLLLRFLRFDPLLRPAGTLFPFPGSKWGDKLRFGGTVDLLEFV